jgi:hypothetical protein
VRCRDWRWRRDPLHREGSARHPHSAGGGADTLHARHRIARRPGASLSSARLVLHRPVAPAGFSDPSAFSPSTTCRAAGNRNFRKPSRRSNALPPSASRDPAIEWIRKQVTPIMARRPDFATLLLGQNATSIFSHYSSCRGKVVMSHCQQSRNVALLLSRWSPANAVTALPLNSRRLASRRPARSVVQRCC